MVYSSLSTVLCCVLDWLLGWCCLMPELVLQVLSKEATELGNNGYLGEYPAIRFMNRGPWRPVWSSRAFSRGWDLFFIKKSSSFCTVMWGDRKNNYCCITALVGTTWRRLCWRAILLKIVMELPYWSKFWRTFVWSTFILDGPNYEILQLHHHFLFNRKIIQVVAWWSSGKTLAPRSRGP